MFPWPTRKAGRVLAWVLALVLLIMMLAALWVGVRGAIAYKSLLRVQTGAAESIGAIAASPADAAPALEALADEAERAHQLTSDPVWSVAESLPWLGSQLSAFSRVASSADELLRGSLLPLATAAHGISLESLRPSEGRLEVDSLRNLVGPAGEAAARAQAAAREVQDIDRTPLLGKVAGAVDQTDHLFTQAASAIDAVSRTAQVLPAMLGSGAERNYLVLVQNNAEWRSLGGITGTAILLHVDPGGVITLRDTQTAGAVVRDLREPIVALPSDVTDIYGTRPARYFHNLTQVPDFTIDGPIAREMYRSKTGVAVDGVLVVDPVVLSYVLQTTGPVALPNGDTLNAANAPSALMNGVYFRYADPSAQDAYFAGATGAVFQALLEGKGTAAGLISALYRAGAEHRLILWSATATEQAVLAGTTIAGSLPESDAHTARFGVYFNDGTGSKMSYYVTPDVSLSCGSATGNRRAALTLRLTLTNSATADAPTTFPEYITGGGAYGISPGTAKVVGNIYLPEGFELESAEIQNAGGFSEGWLQGRRVLTFGMDLVPQASMALSVEVRSSEAVPNAEAVVTPTADPNLKPVVNTACRAGATGGASVQ